jgi:hypothetical protein
MAGITNNTFDCSREDLVDAVDELAGDAGEVSAFAFAANHALEGHAFESLEHDLAAVLAHLKEEVTPRRSRVRFGFKAHHRPRAGGWR